MAIIEGKPVEFLQELVTAGEENRLILVGATGFSIWFFSSFKVSG
jgi:hypothetical protein